MARAMANITAIEAIIGNNKLVIKASFLQPPAGGFLFAAHGSKLGGNDGSEQGPLVLVMRLGREPPYVTDIHIPVLAVSGNG
jgi:hypothetical protein